MKSDKRMGSYRGGRSWLLREHSAGDLHTLTLTLTLTLGKATLDIQGSTSTISEDEYGTCRRNGDIAT